MVTLASHLLDYKVDANQELVALGSTNLISSFFKCLPSAASLTRSAIQESSGGESKWFLSLTSLV